MGIAMSRCAVVSITLIGCSTTFTEQPCDTDEDCGESAVCELRDQAAICVPASEAPLLLGQSAPFTGTNQALGVGMKQGIELAFEEQNAAGGIRGRQLKLVLRDDGYDPLQAEANTRLLVD